ncbi:hypothetical protein AMECASPLE_028863 [Ameca splendens]|uniref:Uncharacterized protein n=1 Tax=Ameca splendens TaxID=208324 RepID=A0ABV0Y5E7_9TELE
MALEPSDSSFNSVYQLTTSSRWFNWFHPNICSSLGLVSSPRGRNVLNHSVLWVYKATHLVLKDFDWILSVTTNRTTQSTDASSTWKNSEEPKSSWVCHKEDLFYLMSWF